ILLGHHLRLLEHALLGGGIEGIEPMEAGEAAELQIDHARQLQLFRRQRPGTGAVEAPFGEALLGLRDPIVERGEAVAPIVMRPIEIAGGDAAIEDVDADRIETLAAWRNESADRTVPCDAPARRRRMVEIAGV